MCPTKTRKKTKQKKNGPGETQSKTFEKKNEFMLTVLEENILRISLVLLLNMCGMTKFNSDMSSNRLFCTGVPVSSRRLFAYEPKVKFRFSVALKEKKIYMLFSYLPQWRRKKLKLISNKIFCDER